MNPRKSHSSHPSQFHRTVSTLLRAKPAPHLRQTCGVRLEGQAVGPVPVEDVEGAPAGAELIGGPGPVPGDRACVLEPRGSRMSGFPFRKKGACLFLSFFLGGEGGVGKKGEA